MSKFKVGDRVNVRRGRDNQTGYCPYLDNYLNCKVVEINSTSYTVYSGDDNYNYIGLFNDSELELVGTLTNKTKIIMTNLITTFKNITRTEPNKTFVKAGVMNEDLSLTSEGKELFIQFMFDKHATEFKTEVVDAILAEQEKK